MRSDDYPAITQMLCDAWHTDPTMDHDLEMKLAEIDLEHCLGRATNAQVAVKDGEIVGVVLGRIDAQETRNGLNSHRTRNMRLLASLLKLVKLRFEPKRRSPEDVLKGVKTV